MTQATPYPTLKQVVPFIAAASGTLLVMGGISLMIEDAAQARSTLAVACIAFFVIITMPIYDINAWSLTKRTIVHTVAMLVTVLPCVALSGWFDTSNLSGIMWMLVTYVLFGLGSWTIGYMVSRLQR